MPAGLRSARAISGPLSSCTAASLRRATSNDGDGATGIGRLAGAEQIYVLPAAWNDAPWWSDAQVDNLRGILDAVKRTYNVDENRVVLSGVSDGGTGAYFVGDARHDALRVRSCR